MNHLKKMVLYLFLFSSLLLFNSCGIKKQITNYETISFGTETTSTSISENATESTSEPQIEDDVFELNYDEESNRYIGRYLFVNNGKTVNVSINAIDLSTDTMPETACIYACNPISLDEHEMFAISRTNLLDSSFDEFNWELSSVGYTANFIESQAVADSLLYRHESYRNESDENEIVTDVFDVISSESDLSDIEWYENVLAYDYLPFGYNVESYDGPFSIDLLSTNYCFRPSIDGIPFFTSCNVAALEASPFYFEGNRVGMRAWCNAIECCYNDATVEFIFPNYENIEVYSEQRNIVSLSECFEDAVYEISEISDYVVDASFYDHCNIYISGAELIYIPIYMEYYTDVQYEYDPINPSDTFYLVPAWAVYFSVGDYGQSTQCDAVYFNAFTGISFLDESNDCL